MDAESAANLLKNDCRFKELARASMSNSSPLVNINLGGLAELLPLTKAEIAHKTAEKREKVIETAWDALRL